MIEPLGLLQILGNTQDPQANRMTGIVLIIVIVISIIAVLIRRAVVGGGGPASSGSSSSGWNRSGFRQAAKAAGLAKDEIRFLEDYGKMLKVSKPDLLFRNQGKLDDFFREVFRSIEQFSESEAAAEERKAALFHIRERLNQRQMRGANITSSRQLGKNMPLSFLVKGDESYPSTILEMEPSGIAVEPPRDPYGESIRLKRGTKLVCFFYAKGRQGYQFDTRVSAWELVGSKEVMIISHSDAVKALPARRHERKEMKVPCTFYRVAVTAEGGRGKEKKKARVEKVPYSGIISDISAGGVGIQSANASQAGEFVKIEFDTGAGTQAAFGKIVRMNKFKNTGGIMHIQFVKITRRSLNAILSFVYGYTGQ
jgi:c-di-GMP-binding flagellar brake protein YcgR